ncbi:MAG: hypothetical protein GY778_08100 [bacterium]|nr:hypothetical protein [bacterium]
MRGGDVFDLYRHLLALVVGTYVVVRAVNFIWRWQLATGSAHRLEGLLRRYLVVSVLRLRIRRFVFELGQVLLLTGVLVYLVWLHAR